MKVLGLGGLFCVLGFWYDKFSPRILNNRHALHTAIILAKTGSYLNFCPSFSFILLSTLVCRDRLCFLFLGSRASKISLHISMSDRCSCSSAEELFLLNFREQLCGVILLQYGELLFPFHIFRSWRESK